MARLFCPGYSAQATEHPASCLPACLLARLLCQGYCTPCHLPVLLARLLCPGYSAKATAHPATCLHSCLLAAQATLPRLLKHPASCLPVCLQDRQLCPGYRTPCHLPVCLFAGQAIVPRLLCPGYCTPCHLPAFLPVSCPGYSAKATETPCLLPASGQATLPRLLNTLHPAYLFAGQATLPRLMHTLPPACLSVCWPGYSAQQTLPPDCLPACVLARLLCPGYSAWATAHPATSLPSCLLAAPGYSAKSTEHPASCLPLDRLLCAGYCTPCHLPACLFAGQAILPKLLHTLSPVC